MKLIFNSKAPRPIVEQRKRALRNLADFTYQCIKKPKNMQPEKALYYLNELKSAIFKMKEYSYDNYVDYDIIDKLMKELRENLSYGQVIEKIIHILPEKVPIKSQLQKDLLSIQKRYGLVYFKDFDQMWKSARNQEMSFIEINSVYYNAFKSFNC